MTNDLEVLPRVDFYNLARQDLTLLNKLLLAIVLGMGMGRVHFSALGLGFEILLGSGLGLPRFVSGQTRSSFFSHFQSILPVFGKKISIFMEGGDCSGQVFGSGFDPTHS